MFNLPSFGTIKLWIIGILTLGLSLVYAWMKTKDAVYDREKLAAEQDARDTEKRVNTATVEGLQNESKSKDNRTYDDDGVV